LREPCDRLHGNYLEFIRDILLDGREIDTLQSPHYLGEKPDCSLEGDGMRHYLLPIPLVILCLGCPNEERVVEPPAPLPDTHIRVSSVVPMIGRISDSVIVNGMYFDSLRNLNPVTFNGVGCYPLRHSDTFLSIRIPLGAASGPLTLHAGNGDSTVALIFNVIPPCGQKLCIIQYDGPPLTEFESLVVDCRGTSVPWTAVNGMDSVIVRQDFCVGDDSHITQLLRFRRDTLSTLFPVTVEGYIFSGQLSGMYVDTLQGLVRIQSWIPNGVVSGKVSWFDKASDAWSDFVFWHDFSQ